MDSEVKQRLDAELAKFDGSGADVGKLSPGAGALTTKLALYIADKLDELEPGGGGGGKDNNIVYGGSKNDPTSTHINTMFLRIKSPVPEGIAYWLHIKADGSEELIPFNSEKPYIFVPFITTNSSWDDGLYDYFTIIMENGERPTNQSIQGYGFAAYGWSTKMNAYSFKSYSGVGYFPSAEITVTP